VITIDDEKKVDHLEQIVRGSVEEKSLLQLEVDRRQPLRLERDGDAERSVNGDSGRRKHRANYATCSNCAIIFG